MNINELERKLKAAKVPASCYSIMKRSGETFFKSESQACDCFYSKLIKYAGK